MARRRASWRYDVIERVSDGPVFTVYKARDRSINQMVELKVLCPTYARNGRFVTGIKRIAHSVIGLPHPNGARIFGVGEEDGTHYIATEYIVGTSLAQKLASEAPLPESEILRIAIQIAEAIHYGHQNGVVHGDLRSQNVVLTDQGQVKVTDIGFGVVYAGVSTSLLEDLLMQRAPYLAPEVGDGASPSPLSDIYSLGVIMYEMATGMLPFTGTSPGQIARGHAEHRVVPPARIHPGVSKAIEDVILKALAKSPGDRYQTAGQLLRDLRQVESGSSTMASSESHESLLGYSVQGASSASEAIPPRQTSEKSLPSVTTGLWLLLLALGILSMIATVVFFYVWFPPTNEVEVPNIVGRHIREARGMIEPLRLILKEEPEFNDKVPEGTVLKCSPEPGQRVKEGREITASISGGPQLVEMPDILELNLVKAKQILEKRGLHVGDVIQRYDDYVPSGAVVGQEPKPGEKMKKSSSIRLFVSRGLSPEVANPPPPIEAPPPPEPTVDDASLVRVISLQVEVPKTGPSRQQVKLIVHDRLGERTVYEKYHDSGENVQANVETHGKDAVIRIFIAGTLVEQDRILSDGRVVRE